VSWGLIRTVGVLNLAQVGCVRKKHRRSVGAVELEAEPCLLPASFIYDAASDVLTIRKPDVKVAYDFAIRITF